MNCFPELSQGSLPNRRLGCSRKCSVVWSISLCPAVFHSTIVYTLGGYLYNPGPRFASTTTAAIKVDSVSFTALLTRSKTIGEDKSVHSRPLIIDAACYLHSKDWMHTRWTLLADTANFERDFVLPASSTNCHGVVHSELRYAIAYAMQNRVLSAISIEGSRVFSFPVTHFWSPHSSRSFLPSATLSLDFPKLQRDYLGGWNAQASDRYARTACRSIINMQRAVIRALHSANPDPLAEQDLAEHFEEFLQLHRFQPDSIAQCLSNLRSPIRPRDLSDTADQPLEDQPVHQPPVRMTHQYLYGQPNVRNRPHYLLKSWVRIPKRD